MQIYEIFCDKESSLVNNSLQIGKFDFVTLIFVTIWNIFLPGLGKSDRKKDLAWVSINTQIIPTRIMNANYRKVKN